MDWVVTFGNFKNIKGFQLVKQMKYIHWCTLYSFISATIIYHVEEIVENTNMNIFTK